VTTAARLGRSRTVAGRGSHLRRIGLNLLYLVPGQTGGRETYARRLVPTLARTRPDLELVAFINRETAEESPGSFGDVRAVTAGISGRSRARVTAAEQFVLPRLVRRHGIDLLHSLGTTAPALPRTPSVVTIHDLIYASHPETHTRARRTGMRVLVPLAARGADRVIADSRFVADDISHRLGVPREGIDVVPLAGKPPRAATPEAELRERLGLGTSPLVLSVLARRPHKNLGRLLQAFARVRVEPPPVLVLPGYRSGFEEELLAGLERTGAGDRVRLLGWVSDTDLEGLYAAASCFVFPSLAEGFGLPVLEAMERGLPVACARASAIPEVAGDAATYFDPLSIDEIAAAVEELLTDRELAERLRKAGLERSRTFSWERTAEETLASYERAHAQASPPRG
jgi:glycosyltransferase involved in cell wall biosynthesis